MSKSPKLEDGDTPARHVSLDDLPEAPLLIILQTVARATGRGAYAAVCRRWRRLMPLAQVHLKLLHDFQKNRTSPNPEASWAKLLCRLPNIESLDIESCRPFSDFILGAIGSSTPKLEELSMTANNVGLDLEEAAGWTPQGLEYLLDMKRHLRSLKLTTVGENMAEVDMPPSLNSLTRLESLALKGVWGLDGAGRLLDSLATLRELELEWGDAVVVPDAITRLTDLTKLTLHNIEALPRGMGSLFQLEHLQLVGAGIATLPASIMSLRRLKSLTLQYVGVVELPPRLLTLPALQHLEIEECSSLVLPSSFWQVSGKQSGPLTLVLKLYEHRIPETLIVMTPRLRRLTLGAYSFPPPHSMGKLSNLTHLNVEWLHDCAYLPPLGGLHQLQALVLRSCEELCCLPSDIGSLELLQELTIYRCILLTELPEFANAFPSLKLLHVEDLPALKAIPDSIMQLSHAASIHIDMCPSVKEFPSGVLAHPGLTATARAFLERMQARQRATQLLSASTAQAEGGV